MQPWLTWNSRVDQVTMLVFQSGVPVSSACPGCLPACSSLLVTFGHHDGDIEQKPGTEGLSREMADLGDRSHGES